MLQTPDTDPCPPRHPRTCRVDGLTDRWTSPANQCEEEQDGGNEGRPGERLTESMISWCLQLFQGGGPEETQAGAAQI